MEARHVPGTIQFTPDGYLRCTACGGRTMRYQTQTRTKATFGRWYYKCAPPKGTKACTVMYEWHEEVLREREKQGVPDPEPVSSSERWTLIQPQPPSTPSRPRATSSSPEISTGRQLITTPGPSLATPLRAYSTAPVTTVQSHLLEDSPPASVDHELESTRTSNSGTSVRSEQKRAARVPVPASVSSSQSTIIEDGSDEESSAWFTPPSQVASRTSRSAPTVALSLPSARWDHGPSPPRYPHRSPASTVTGRSFATSEYDPREAVDLIETVAIPFIRQNVVEQEQLLAENAHLRAQLQNADERYFEMEIKIKALEESVRMLEKQRGRPDGVIDDLTQLVAVEMSQNELTRAENAALRSRCERAEARYEDLNSRMEKFERMFQ